MLTSKAFRYLLFRSDGDTYPVSKKDQFYDMSERMYVVEGLSKTKIREETGVSLQTLGKWCDYGEWDKKRAEYVEQNASLSAKLTRLKHKIVDDALKDTDPQKIYALAMLIRSDKNADSGGKQPPEKLDEKLSKEETVKKILEVLT